MKPVSFAAAMAAAVFLQHAGSEASAAIVVGDDPVLYWSQVLIGGYTGSPLLTSRGYAMVGVALHDAVNAAAGNPHKSYLHGVSVPGGDVRAAASVAAHDVLTYLAPGNSVTFDNALTSSLALVSNGAAKTNGIATGHAIAAAVIANRAADGAGAVAPYVGSTDPGHYQPTPPGNVPPVAPQWGGVTPWLLESGDQFRAGPPPALDSADYAAAFNEVKAIGALNSATRTAEQTAAALFWDKAVGDGPWVTAAINLAQAQGRSSLDNASMIAMLTTAIADSAIAVWDSKYTYDFWRPVTAIRNADLDGNGATIADPNWQSLITAPPHQSYISAHSAVGAAASTVLDDLLGSNLNLCLDWAGLSRCWDSFDAAAADASNSRLWGGIHYGFDITAGRGTGQQIGQYVLGRSTFQAVPEPASWMMMIAGFGIIGGALRQRAKISVMFA